MTSNAVSPSDRLAELARTMIDSGQPAFSFWQELSEIVEIVKGCTTFRIDPHEDIAAGESRSSGGQAISPTQAAMCADDAQRTITFMRGLYQAVQDLLEERIDCEHPIRVLYAGSGPYAILGLPLMALLSAKEVRFNILDLHEESLSSVRAVIEKLGYSDHTDSIELADACEYKIPPNRTLDLVLTETMKVCLAEEPQVMIARNLIGQAPDATLIPNRITVGAAMIDLSKEFSEDGSEPERDHVGLGSIFELSKASIGEWASEGIDALSPLPASRVQIPAGGESRFSARLCTEVEVYEGHVLRTHDCGLTVLSRFPTPENSAEEGVTPPGSEVQFSYNQGHDPGLVCEFVRV